MSLSAVGTLKIPDTYFEEAGDAEDPRCRLIATVDFRDIHCHLEAIAVKYNEETKRQEVDNLFNDKTFTGMELIAGGADGPFYTTEIGGRDYVITMTPFCK